MPAGMKPLENSWRNRPMRSLGRVVLGRRPPAPGHPGGGPACPVWCRSSGRRLPRAARRGRCSARRPKEAPCWPSATADIRSPSLSSDEQSSEASLDTNWTPLPADTAENLTLALLDSVAGKRYTTCTGEIMLHSQVFSGGSLESRSFAVVYCNSVSLRCCGALGWVTHNNSFCEAWLSRLSADRYIFSLLFFSLNSLSLYFDIHASSYIFSSLIARMWCI